MVERRMALFGVLIEQHRVPLRERATFAVLAGKADWTSLFQQRAEGKRLGGCPINPFAAFDRFGAILEKTLDRPVNGESLRNSCDFPADIPQFRNIDARIASARIVGVACALPAGPASVHPGGLVPHVALAG